MRPSLKDVTILTTKGNKIIKIDNNIYKKTFNLNGSTLISLEGINV